MLPKQVGRDVLNQILPGFMQDLVSITNSTFLPTQNTVYAFALDRKQYEQPIAGVLFGISAGGVGFETSELAICTSLVAPLGGGATAIPVTPQVVVSLNGAGLNSSGSKNISISYTIPANKQGWLAIRLGWSGTQPTFVNAAISNGGTNVVRTVAGIAALTVGVGFIANLATNGSASGPGMCYRTQ